MQKSLNAAIARDVWQRNALIDMLRNGRPLPDVRTKIDEILTGRSQAKKQVTE